MNKKSGYELTKGQWQDGDTVVGMRFQKKWTRFHPLLDNPPEREEYVKKEIEKLLM